MMHIVLSIYAATDYRDLRIVLGLSILCIHEAQDL